MIKSNELRIGNYIIDDSYCNNKEVIIDEDWLEVCMAVQDYESLLPIPLTEEWLLRFGFSVNFTSDADEYWTLELDGVKYCDLSLMSVDKNGFMEVCLFPYEDLFRYKYVHALQNLFFCLCGKELELK